MSLYDWSGSKILMYPVVQNRRFIRKGDRDIQISMDVRQWLTPSECWELRNVTEELFKTSSVSSLLFDRRAWLCWKHLVEKFEYVRDDKDLWQLPSETLARRQGDCEDLAFLLASLLLVAGISSYCVRVVFGPLFQYSERAAQWEPKGTHAWVIYKNESGRWCLLDPTIDGSELPPNEKWPVVEPVPEHPLMQKRRYLPKWCCNRDHAWAIDPVITEWTPGLYSKAATVMEPVSMPTS